MKQLFLVLMMLQLLLAIDVKELYVGDVITDDIQSTEKRYYQVKVKPGKILTVNVSHLSNDVDLYLKTELKDKKLPTFHNYNCRSVNKGKKSESCSYIIKQGRIGDNAEQTVNILIYGFEFTSYTLEIKERQEPRSCKQSYKPVCARVAVECFKAPCKPKYQTFDNLCVMKNNPNATYIRNGRCEVKYVNTKIKHNNKIKPCNKVYKPVCAQVRIPCWVAPCQDPIKQTFDNLCLMKNNSQATLIHRGKCKVATPTNNNRPRPCNKVYKPVCAKMAVDCLHSPCKPKYQTFANLCLMKNDSKAKFERNGRCEVEHVPYKD